AAPGGDGRERATGMRPQMRTHASTECDRLSRDGPGPLKVSGEIGGARAVHEVLHLVDLRAAPDERVDALEGLLRVCDLGTQAPEPRKSEQAVDVLQPIGSRVDDRERLIG